jgi:hypothetical protein
MEGEIMEIFKDEIDDGRYYNWLDRHTEGFVINSDKAQKRTT